MAQAPGNGCAVNAVSPNCHGPNLCALFHDTKQVWFPRKPPEGRDTYFCAQHCRRGDTHVKRLRMHSIQKDERKWGRPAGCGSEEWFPEGRTPLLAQGPRSWNAFATEGAAGREKNSQWPKRLASVVPWGRWSPKGHGPNLWLTFKPSNKFDFH